MIATNPIPTQRVFPLKPRKTGTNRGASRESVRSPTALGQISTVARQTLSRHDGQRVYKGLQRTWLTASWRIGPNGANASNGSAPRSRQKHLARRTCARIDLSVAARVGLMSMGGVSSTLRRSGTTSAGRAGRSAPHLLGRRATSTLFIES